tara:strand:- start:254 stop:1093 length:840 start_codon:yes stop_codon:yes gene_type:complete
MGARRQRRHEQRMMDMTQSQLDEAQGEKKIQREILAKQKEQYRQFQFKNPYANMENQFEGMTVDTKAANFAMQQANQQRADLMQNLRGAAGGSGIASLAQVLANQGALQAQQASISIAQQERQNQQMERQGAGQADMTERGGEAMVQSAEMQRQTTLLGIEYGGMGGANAAVQGAYGNQMSAMAAAGQMQSARYGANMQLAGSFVNAASDIRLKKNINKIGQSPSGLNIYSFEYKDSKYGRGLFQGVISNEIPQEAVVQMDNGYDAVDYSMLDVDFKQI